MYTDSKSSLVWKKIFIHFTSKASVRFCIFSSWFSFKYPEWSKPASP